MTNPLLLLDVGNTTIELGFALPGQDMVSFRLPTQHELTPDSLGLQVVQLCALAGLQPRAVASWVVCSVVPQLDTVLRAAAKRFCGCGCLFAGRDVPIPLRNQYERPREVGMDRLVTAYGAHQRYDALGYIVIDFGTATTFDVVKGDDYLGGLICPGVFSSVSALSTRTAKLPQADLRLDSPNIQVGRSTSQSLNQGLVHGFASMTEGLVARLKPQLPDGSLVVATGGFAAQLEPYCSAFDLLAPDLLLDGLRRVYMDWQDAE